MNEETICYLVYGRAEGCRPRAANDQLNNYIGDAARGQCVWHDHFKNPPGGVAVFEVTDKDQVTALHTPPGEGWTWEVHRLVFSTTMGFIGQAEYTQRTYSSRPGEAAGSR